MRVHWSLLLFGLLIPGLAEAHIGTQNVVFETRLPPLPLRVIIRPPGVVPGLADIDVRVLTNGVQRVTVLPVHWRAGVEGAPPPDVAKPVEGEPGLYHAELWLMARGAYSVHVNVEAGAVTNTVIVPVNSLATTRLGMSKPLVGILAALGVLLFLLAISIVGAAVRESVLPPGTVLSRRRMWLGRAAVVGAGLFLALALHGGRLWWDARDRDYRNNRMHQPVECTATVQVEATQRRLQINVLTNDARARWSGLVPDHGKLMHVFLMREPDLDVLAHLHPVRRNAVLFESALPPLPAGNYRVYADVTHENGFSQTLTALARVPASSSSGALADGTSWPRLAPDPDDSWFQGKAAGASLEHELGSGLRMIWDRPSSFAAAREVTLQFRVLDPDNRPARLEPYLSMLGHAALRREDGAVFTHLHPAGSVSVAAQQVFQIRAGEKQVKRITPEMMEQYCQPPSGEQLQQPLSFPYEFPHPGRYVIWVQVKVAGQVRTGVFEAVVEKGTR